MIKGLIYFRSKSFFLGNSKIIKFYCVWLECLLYLLYSLLSFYFFKIAPNFKIGGFFSLLLKMTAKKFINLSEKNKWKFLLRKKNSPTTGKLYQRTKKKKEKAQPRRAFMLVFNNRDFQCNF